MRVTIIVISAAAVAAGAYYLASGQRYKLHLDDAAGRCWAAIQEVTFAPTATRFRSIDGPRTLDDGLIEATIQFTSDNLFAGSLDVSGTCIFDPADASGGRRAVRILIDDRDVDAEVLDAVNAALDARG
jgi:hypothetical protein